MFGLIPFRTNEIEKKGGSFNSLFDGFFNDDFFSPMNFGFDTQKKFNIDVKEASNEYLVSAELSGVKKDDINLEYKDNNLIISAKRNQEINEQKDNYIRKERTYGKIARSLYVPNIDKSKIKAKFENGELQIILPKMNNVIDDSNRIQIQ